MNGRVYDAEIGRFLSADAVIQDVTNLQSLNAYSYVLNNPLSFTDPSGFFFSSLFRAIGRFFKSVFRAIGNVFKAVLRSSIGRAIIQVAACTFGGVIGCVAITAALTLATGGSITEALTAAAFSFVSMGVWTAVGVAVRAAGIAGNALLKGLVHGVVGGALSVSQGGSFLQGFASNAIGAATGVLTNGTAIGDDIVLDTAVVAVAGGVSAELSGGKFANGAITAAFANLYNKWSYKGKGAAEAIASLKAQSPTAAKFINDIEGSWYTYTFELTETGVPLDRSPGATSGELRHAIVNTTLVPQFQAHDAAGNWFNYDLARMVAHELSHLYTVYETNPLAARAQLYQNKSITYENTIARELDPNAPQRVPQHGCCWRMQK